MENVGPKRLARRKCFDNEKWPEIKTDRLTVSHLLTIATEPTPTQIFLERLPNPST